MARPKAVEKAIEEKGPVLERAIRDWHLEGMGFERIAKEVFRAFSYDISHRAIGHYIQNHEHEWVRDEVVSQ